MIRGIELNEYHKIQSIYKRDEKGKFIIGEYSCPEFNYLKNNIWIATEKVDGANIRIIRSGNEITIKGRSDNAQIPTFLYEKLQDMFTLERFKFFKDEVTVCLYGEGYGNRIQKVGKQYSDDIDFILFDIKIGKWWLKQSDVTTYSKLLNIKRAPILGYFTLNEAIDFVKGEDCYSRVSEKELKMEGLVLRPEIDLFARNGERIITKIKYRDFE